MAGISPGSPQPPPEPQQRILPPPPGPGAPATAQRFSPRWWEQRLNTYPRRTRVLTAFCIIFLPTVGILAALLIAGQSAPSSSTQSVPGAASLVNVTVQLLDATCLNNQIGLSCNHNFYLLGALVAPDAASSQAPVLSQAIVTPPMQISDGADSPFKPAQTVFAGTIAANAMVMGGFIAYDARQSLDTSMLAAWSQAVARDVAMQLHNQGIDSGNLAGPDTAMQVLNLAERAWSKTAHLTSRNAEVLGQPQLLMLPATGPMTMQDSLVFSKASRGIFDEGWDYTVKYQITRAPMASAARPMSEQEALTRRASAVTIGAIVGDVARPGRILTITNTAHPEQS